MVSGAVVRLRSAVALLGSFPALAGVDLEVDPGAVVLLKGANGAGKSTLLRVCAGLVAVAAGQAEVLGCDLVADRRAVRRRVGLVGHTSFLYDDLTVEDNVRFAVRSAGAPASGVGAALDRLGLTGRLRQADVGKLSAGQRRRAALAVLVVRQPELWLLDEPHAGLDLDARALLDELLVEVVAGGASVIVASHELERVGSLAARVVMLAGGRVVQPVADCRRAVRAPEAAHVA